MIGGIDSERKRQRDREIEREESYTMYEFRIITCNTCIASRTADKARYTRSIVMMYIICRLSNNIHNIVYTRLCSVYTTQTAMQFRPNCSAHDDKKSFDKAPKNHPETVATVCVCLCLCVSFQYTYARGVSFQKYRNRFIYPHHESTTLLLLTLVLHDHHHCERERERHLKNYQVIFDNTRIHTWNLVRGQIFIHIKICAYTIHACIHVRAKCQAFV